MKTTKNNKQGFTLIEILIVVSVIGVMASLAVPFFKKHLRNTRAGAFASDIRTLANAGSQYSLESGFWVPDTSTGEFPEELDGYFSRRKYLLGSPLGGEWDFEQDDLGDFTSAVGVHGAAEPDEVFVLVDKQIDDGDLSTGVFQKLGEDRYYYIIED